MPTNRPLVRLLKCLVLLVALLLCPLCFGESIVVHVLDEKHGQPLPHEAVVLRLTYGDKAKAAGIHEMVMNLDTDSNGEAQFLMPSEKLDSLDVRVNLTDYSGRCSCRIVADPEKVLRDGVTVGPHMSRSAKSSTNALSQPGQIFFVVRPYSLLERVLFSY